MNIPILLYPILFYPILSALLLPGVEVDSLTHSQEAWQKK